MIKVLIIEDSALMRKYLREILEEGGEFEVSSARDGLQGLEMVHQLQPDVVTMDINMPGMDGLTCLSRIMAESPRPVVMVSSLTEKGTMATLESLAMGAVDYIPKPGGTVSHNIKQVAEELCSKVRAASKSKVRTKGGTVAQMRARAAPATPAVKRRLSESGGRLAGKKLMLVGSSTGGPRTVEEIFTKLPAHFPVPILLSQHMPATFTEAFARRLDGICPLKVQQAGHLTVLEPGNVYVAKGEADILVRSRNGQRVAVPTPWPST
ncbi:MAG: response regulator [Magnetococcales bacterium]|nr:response regulator [Magnetococcales bacterium]